MRLLHSFGYLCCCAALAGCSRSDTRAASDTGPGATTASVGGDVPVSSAAEPPSRSAMGSLKQFAGRWNVRAVPETGDRTPTTFILTATADTAGWTITFPNRAPVPMRLIRVGGDSVVADAGPYESVRRKGVQVTTRSVIRREGDRLLGRVVAGYATTGPDSILRLRTEGTRAP